MAVDLLTIKVVEAVAATAEVAATAVVFRGRRECDCDAQDIEARSHGDCTGGAYRGRVRRLTSLLSFSSLSSLFPPSLSLPSNPLPDPPLPSKERGWIP